MRNLFTRVVFSEHSEGEIGVIAGQMATTAVETGTISTDHLKSVLKLHFEINRKLQIKEIGGLGSVQPFNLRDIAKFLVCCASIVSQRTVHCRLYSRATPRLKWRISNSPRA